MFASKIPAWVLAPKIILLSTLLFSVAYFLLAHEGFYWLDDYIYTKYAWQVQQGTFDLNKPMLPPNPLTNRVMIFAPAALFYALFGFNIYVATLWPLLCTVGSSVLVYAIYRRSNPVVASLGILLLGLYFHTLFLGSYFYPDNILMFFGFAALAALHRFRYVVNGRQPFFLAAGFVFFNFLAFLSKETIAYYAPFYLILFLSDLFAKRHRAFWIYSLVLGAVLLGAYFTFYYFETGSFFSRFDIIAQSNAAYHEGAKPKPFSQLLNRLTMGPLYFFMGSGIYVPFVFAIGLFVKTRKSVIFLARNEAGFWLLAALLVLLQFWFGSTSTVYYNPITLVPRMCMLMMPPLCLAGALGLQLFLDRDRQLAGLYAGLFGVAIYFERGNMLAMYVPLTLYFAWHWWQLRRPAFRVSYRFFAVLLLGVLSLRPLHFMRKPSLMGFQEQNALIKTHLNQTTGNYLVIGDPWLEFMHDFHYDFQPNPHYKYRSYGDTIPEISTYQETFILVNRAGLSNPDMAKMQVIQEPEIDRFYPAKELVAEKGPVRLYKLKKDFQRPKP